MKNLRVILILFSLVLSANLKAHESLNTISMCVGWVVLALFAEGLLRLIGVIPPVFPWLNITLQ